MVAAYEECFIEPDCLHHALVEVTRGKRDKTRVLSKVERGVLAVSGQTEHQPSTGGQGAVGGEIREPEGDPETVRFL